MKKLNWIALALLLSLGAFCLPVHAMITVTTDHGPNPNFDPTYFDGMLSSTDLIQGLIATELPGDKGWHPANTNPADQLPAFTDGLSDRGTGLTGLLNDFPGDGVPAKTIQYDLAQASNIGAINILTGNANDPDGRVFCTVVIRYSTDNGANFSPLGGYVPGLGANSSGYYQSDVPLAINKPGGSFDDPPNLETMVTLTNIADDSSPLIASGVTNLQFDFYSTNNSANWYWDPFDGINPFTGYDDGYPQAFSSPLVWEIDVLEGPDVSADFDEDSDVDVADAMIWQRGYGIDDGTALIGDGDADGNGNVDGVDLAIWKGQFGMGGALSAASAIPEPATLVSFVVGMLGLGWSRRARG